VVNDANDREIAGIGLASGSLPGGGTTHADHPIAGDTTHGINGNFLGAAIEDHLQVFVLEIGNAVGGDQRLNHFADQHVSALLRSRT
jgi:hypothetical protein